MRVLTIATLTLAAGLAGSATSQTSGPVAVYWMSAETSSGFSMGGGGAPSTSQMMGMMMGGGRGGNANKTLRLELGSKRSPTPGEPSAQHLAPPALGAGQMLPLVTPQPRPQVDRDVPGEIPNYRMLIFWGCGDQARQGQPVVIDTSKLAKGVIPPELASFNRGWSLASQNGPAPGRSTTYGDWPNTRGRTRVPADGSLVGAHAVQGNYTPTINFTLGPNQDFLGALNITQNAATAAGSSMLGWRPAAGAQAYLAAVMGQGKRKNEFVMWTSSEVQTAAMMLPPYLSNGDITRLVASRALMGPQATSCLIPKQVVESVDGAMVQLHGYGNEANFSHPPKPANPKQAWNLEWTVKVRYRTTTGALLGMEGMDMSGGEDGPPRRPGQPPQPQKKPGMGSILKGLGGF